MSNAILNPNPMPPPWSARQAQETNARIAALESFVGDVMRSQTFTNYGRTPEENTPMRTPLGNRAAVLLGLPEHPTQGGLDTTLDSVS